MMLIVVRSKRVDLLLRVLQRLKPVDVQTLLAEATIEGFDGRVVRRFAAPAEIQNDGVRVGRLRLRASPSSV